MCCSFREFNCGFHIGPIDQCLPLCKRSILYSPIKVKWHLFKVGQFHDVMNCVCCWHTLFKVEVAGADNERGKHCLAWQACKAAHPPQSTTIAISLGKTLKKMFALLLIWGLGLLLRSLAEGGEIKPNGSPKGKKLPSMIGERSFNCK